MEAIQEAGYAKSIGVSNVQGALLLDILKSVLALLFRPFEILFQEPLH